MGRSVQENDTAWTNMLGTSKIFFLVFIPDKYSVISLLKYERYHKLALRWSGQKWSKTNGQTSCVLLWLWKRVIQFIPRNLTTRRKYTFEWFFSSSGDRVWKTSLAEVTREKNNERGTEIRSTYDNHSREISTTLNSYYAGLKKQRLTN